MSRTEEHWVMLSFAAMVLSSLSRCLASFYNASLSMEKTYSRMSNPHRMKCHGILFSHHLPSLVAFTITFAAAEATASTTTKARKFDLRLEFSFAFQLLAQVIL